MGFVDERSARSLSQGGFGRRARAQVHVKVVSMSKLIWNKNDGEGFKRDEEMMASHQCWTIAPFTSLLKGSIQHSHVIFDWCGESWSVHSELAAPNIIEMLQ
jgi:hypothetical protein